MHAQKLLLRTSLTIMMLAALLATGGPATLAAGSDIIIDDGTTADGCGETYNGKTALTNPVTAIGNAPSKSTVVICPGTYSLTGIIAITHRLNQHRDPFSADHRRARRDAHRDAERQPVCGFPA